MLKSMPSTTDDKSARGVNIVCSDVFSVLWRATVK